MNPLIPLGPDIWTQAGSTLSTAGFLYPTRMVVIRLDNGSLFIWSPVAMEEDAFKAIDALGPVAHLVSPSHFHHLFMSDWISRYPNAQVHAAPHLDKKRPDLKIATVLGNVPHPDWAGQIDQTVLEGNILATEVAFYHRASQTVIICDLIQQLDPDSLRGWRAWIAKADRMTGIVPHMPRKFEWAFTSRSKARTGIETLLSWTCQTLIFAHGPVTQDGGTHLRRIFAPLLARK